MLPVFLRSVLQVVAAIALLSLAPLHAGAADKENAQRPERFVTLTGDNDFFAGYDHHYTNGFQFAISADGMSLPKFMRSLPPLRSGNDPHHLQLTPAHVLAAARCRAFRHLDRPDPHQQHTTP